MAETSSQENVLDTNSGEFVNFSASAPLNEFLDVVNNVKWEYRVAGPSEKQEAVVFIPGIYENTNTMFLVAPKLVSLGYRVLIVSIPAYSKISELLVGFDTLTAKLHIFRAHLIGNDFGGFISLFLNAAQFLSCEIASLTLVSSYTNSSTFKKTITFFTPVSQGTLIAEITPDRVPEPLKPSVEFVAKIVNSFSSALVLARIKCRQSQMNAPIPTENTEKILVIQPVDWAFKLENSHRPNKTIQGVKIVKMQKGGLFPHLAAPEDFFDHILSHIKEFESPSTA